MPDDVLDVPLVDHDLLTEVETLARLMIAAGATSEDRLCPKRIDEILRSL